MLTQLIYDFTQADQSAQFIIALTFVFWMWVAIEAYLTHITRHECEPIDYFPQEAQPIHKESTPIADPWQHTLDDSVANWLYEYEQLSQRIQEYNHKYYSQPKPVALLEPAKDTEKEDIVSVTNWTRTQLKAMKVVELRKVCKAIGVKQSGKKAFIIDRILQAQM